VRYRLHPDAGGGATPPSGGATPPAPPAGSGGGATPPGDGTGGGATPPGSPDAVSRLEAAIARERELRESAEATAKAEKRRADELERARKKAADDDLSEVEKLRKDLAERDERDAKRDQRERAAILRADATTIAERLGYRTPAIADRLIAADVEYDDDNRPQNVEKLLKALLEKEPGLGKTSTPDLGHGNRGASGENAPGMNDILHALRGGG
jgi:hypothetical protein